MIVVLFSTHYGRPVAGIELWELDAWLQRRPWNYLPSRGAVRKYSTDFGTEQYWAVVPDPRAATTLLEDRFGPFRQTYVQQYLGESPPTWPGIVAAAWHVRIQALPESVAPTRQQAETFWALPRSLRETYLWWLLGWLTVRALSLKTLTVHRNTLLGGLGVDVWKNPPRQAVGVVDQFLRWFFRKDIHATPEDPIGSLLAHDIQRRNTMTAWAVTNTDPNYPGQWVARPFDAVRFHGRFSQLVLAAGTLDDLTRQLPDAVACRGMRTWSDGHTSGLWDQTGTSSAWTLEEAPWFEPWRWQR